MWIRRAGADPCLLHVPGSLQASYLTDPITRSPPIIVAPPALGKDRSRRWSMLFSIHCIRSSLVKKLPIRFTGFCWIQGFSLRSRKLAFSQPNIQYPSVFSLLPKMATEASTRIWSAMSFVLKTRGLPAFPLPPVSHTFVDYPQSFVSCTNQREFVELADPPLLPVVIIRNVPTTCPPGGISCGTCTPSPRGRPYG